MKRIMMKPLVICLLLVVVAGGMSLARPEPVLAHPLGNFTINHYSRIDVSQTGIQVYRVLDMAEIPTFQERQQIDKDRSGVVDVAENAAYASAKAEELRSRIVLRVNGKQVKLRAQAQEMTFPAGQGDLLLLRLSITYAVDLPENWQTDVVRVDFEDTNYANRIGWREIVVRPAPGVQLLGSDTPTQDLSKELTSYPQDRLQSPLDVKSLSFELKSGEGQVFAPAPNNEARAVKGNRDSPLARYAGLIAEENLTLGVIAVALASAFLFGGIHALSPGHGKTIVAAYLVGSKGTGRDALVLGLTVTATHTSSVYLLGFVTLYLSEYVVPEKLYPWLGIASGGLIVAMGLALFLGRLRSSRLIPEALTWLKGQTLSAFEPQQEVALLNAAGPVLSHGSPGSDTHAEDDHHHHHPEVHGHSHGFDSTHHHGAPDVGGESVTWRRLIGLGIFGGLLPCPSAIVVMLGAITLHRVAFGLFLILFFSMGLAAVLTGIGFALVYGGKITSRIPILRLLSDRASGRSGMLAFAVRAFPVGSAAAVLAAGLLITVRALAQQGIL